MSPRRYDACTDWKKDPTARERSEIDVMVLVVRNEQGQVCIVRIVPSADTRENKNCSMRFQQSHCICPIRFFPHRFFFAPLISPCPTKEEQKTMLAFTAMGKPLPLTKYSTFARQSGKSLLAMRVESMTFSLQELPWVLSQMVWFPDWANSPVC
jgi:hypothetical protein